MLFTSFLTFLVFSSFKPSFNGFNILINRLGIITISFVLILLILSIDLIPLIPGITLYNNWISLTSVNLPFIYIILLLVITLLIYNTFDNKLNTPYYLIIVLANLIGLLLFPMVNDLLALYIIIELQSYSLYLLTGLHNRSFNASRASLLYFLMGGVASAIILLALYFAYSTTGSTNISDIIIYNNMLNNNNINYMDILVIALFFKMGLAPLHRWSIAVYNYAPTYITAYISIVAKLSIIGWLYTNSILYSNYILIISFILSLLIGSYKPLFQINIKTILAYSGILNFGYILLALMSKDISVYIYLIQYVLTHILLFFIILGSSEYITKPISKWSPLQYIHQLKLPNLTLSFSLIIALFSLIGIPPLPGFYAKLAILTGAISENYILECLILIVCSVIATYYYANIIKITIKSENIIGQTINPLLAYSISVLTLILLSLFIMLPYISEGLYLIII